MPGKPRPRIVFISMATDCRRDFPRQFTRRHLPEARGFKAKLAPVGVERFPLPASFRYVGRGSSDFASEDGNANDMASVTFSIAKIVPAACAIVPASVKVTSG